MTAFAYIQVEFHTCAKEGITDFLGLPQATFHYEYSAEEKGTMVSVLLTNNQSIYCHHCLNLHMSCMLAVQLPLVPT